jgi:uncharacterized protein YdbL (DUF1318 family)
MMMMRFTMRSRTFVSILFATLMTLVFSAGTALAQDKAELQQRSEQRYPKLLDAKRAGEIGETADGFVEAVKGKDLSGDMRQIVEDENRDRRALYAILAKETNTDESLVARRAGKRNFENARPGEWLKSAAGKWEQKK